MVLFTLYKTMWVTGYAISSHCLAALTAKLSAFNRHMQHKAYYSSNLK